MGVDEEPYEIHSLQEAVRLARDHLNSLAPSSAPLSSTARSLPYLISLQLPGLRIQSFGSSMASALMCLTSLDLSDNLFSQLPIALTQITTLENLNMSYNHELQLTDRDPTILATLPHLRVFDASKGFDDSVGWSQQSIMSVIAIKARLPGLYLPGFRVLNYDDWSLRVRM
jgi:Leucine-rich repeat (LRR) protein